MSKRTITQIFVGSLVAIAAGVVMALAAGAVALANGSLVKDGPDVVGVRASSLGWAMLAVAVLGILTVFGGLIAQFVAWLGAVINTSQLTDKTWFIVLLVTGLLSFGFIAMIVYVFAGPGDPRPAASGAPQRADTPADVEPLQGPR